ncbi:MAG: phosphonate metabolism transcriptional regulator PhnF [Steroidobacteraceae bacterium]
MTAATARSERRSVRRRGCAWSRIAGEVTRNIRVGAYPPGGRLPAASELADRFSVNRHTVRRAIAELAARGVVRVVQGSGTFVQEFALELMLGRRTRQSVSLRQAGVSGTLRVLGAVRMRAPTQVARALQIAPRQRVLRVQTLGEARRRVLHVGERFFPLPQFEGLDERIRRCGSITRAFAECGVTDYLRRDSRVSAVLPVEQIAVLLRQAMCRPVLRIESVNEDLERRPIEYARAYFAGDRVGLRVTADE